MRRAALLLILLALFSGCASVEELRPTGTAMDGTPVPTRTHNGLEAAYPFDPDTVFDAVLSALAQEDLAVIETDVSRRYILAEGSMNLWSYGENVAVYLEPMPGGTRVSVVCERKMATNLFAADHAPQVHKRLAALLGRAGK